LKNSSGNTDRKKEIISDDFLRNIQGVDIRYSDLLKFLTDTLYEAILITSPELEFAGPRIVFVNPGFTRMSGYESEEILGQSPRILQGPATCRATLDRLRTALTQGDEFKGEAINYRQDGTTYIVEWVVKPFRNSAGEVLYWVSAQQDITEKRRTEQALVESEARLRSILENVRDYAIFTTDAEDRVDTWFPGATRVYGWSAEEIYGRPSSVLFTSEDQENGVPEDEISTARHSGTAPNIRWHLHKDGSRIFIEGSVTALRRSDGAIRGYLKIGQDVTAQHRAEELRQLLVREVNHRAQNVLTVVQAALRLTKAADLQSYRAAVEGRVLALAGAHRLLADNHWEGADLHALLQSELAPFLTDQRADLQGPEVKLPAQTAQALAIAFHELATNAVKYGSLSVPEGHILLSWQETGAPRFPLKLCWQERGGPLLMKGPSRRGMGMRMLDALLRRQLGGLVALDWTPTGLVCNIQIPLLYGTLADKDPQDGAA
jgi:PAS domain S-box-containing protein